MNLFLILASFIGLTRGADWSYDYETKWPASCRNGQQQSPINILTRDALVDKFGVHIRGPLNFRGYGNVKAHATNTGHTLRWTMDEERPAPVLSGGPLRSNYTLLQFHLHWLSEHAIDGMKYPLEIHMVHIKSGLNLTQALKQPDGLAVVGILCQLHDDDATHALEQIISDIPKLFERTEEPNESSLTDLSRLLSPSPQSFYTYHGSLTTPNCDEVVTWIVMDKPLQISHSQYQLFGRVDLGSLENYRSLQAVNRVVYHSVASCASLIAPSFLALLASSFQCLAINLTSVIKKTFNTICKAKKKVLGGDLKDCKLVS